MGCDEMQRLQHSSNFAEPVAAKPEPVPTDLAAIAGECGHAAEQHSMTEWQSLKADLYNARREIFNEGLARSNAEAELDAWHSQFGTTQLSHAIGERDVLNAELAEVRKDLAQSEIEADGRIEAMKELAALAKLVKSWGRKKK
jgi:hypothetical protein